MDGMGFSGIIYRGGFTICCDAFIGVICYKHLYSGEGGGYIQLPFKQVVKNT